MNPLAERSSRKGVLVLDGALATELERNGCDLDHPLWSARVLMDEPGQIEKVHLSYLAAGADLIVTSGYQASVPGFRNAGLSERQARELYRDSIRIAVEARHTFASRNGIPESDRALVAASIGPYGAYLADGSEYRGHYSISERELQEFHGDRIAMVMEMMRDLQDGPELMAFETIPSLKEALILARILKSHPGAHAWLSFTCRDDARTCEGQRIEDCARELESFAQIVAIGVNCTAPVHITPLVRKLAATTVKPIIVYPNSGEGFDPVRKQWTGERTVASKQAVAGWVAAGASIVGGCCRTTPEDIARMVSWRDELAGGTRGASSGHR